MLGARPHPPLLCPPTKKKDQKPILQDKSTSPGPNPKALRVQQMGLSLFFRDEVESFPLQTNCNRERNISSNPVKKTFFADVLILWQKIKKNKNSRDDGAKVSFAPAAPLFQAAHPTQIARVRPKRKDLKNE